jgi:hypothetical protein
MKIPRKKSGNRRSFDEQGAKRRYFKFAPGG